MEYWIGAYLAMVVFLGIGVHRTADDEDLDNAGLMFLMAWLILIWPITLLGALVGKMLKGRA